MIKISFSNISIKYFHSHKTLVFLLSYSLFCVSPYNIGRVNYLLLLSCFTKMVILTVSLYRLECGGVRGRRRGEWSVRCVAGGAPAVELDAGVGRDTPPRALRAPAGLRPRAFTHARLLQHLHNTAVQNLATSLERYEMKSRRSQRSRK